MFGAVLGAVTISTRLFDRSFLQPGDRLVLIRVSGSRAGAPVLLAKALSGFPDAKINTVGQYVNSSEASINTLLNLFYVMLALSVIVSLFGIVNTLALSIVERTKGRADHLEPHVHLPVDDVGDTRDQRPPRWTSCRCVPGATRHSPRSARRSAIRIALNA